MLVANPAVEVKKEKQKEERLIGVGMKFEKVMIDKAKLLGTLELPSNRMKVVECQHTFRRI